MFLVLGICPASADNPLQSASPLFSLLAPQHLCFAQLSHGTSLRLLSAGAKCGTALSASAPGRSAATSTSHLLFLGERGVDKAGLFPGEGATFKLEITNLPHCCAHVASAIDVGHFGSPGAFCSFLNFPPSCSLCCFPCWCPWPGEGQQQGWRTDFPGHWSKQSCDCKSARGCNQSFVFMCMIQHRYKPH